MCCCTYIVLTCESLPILRFKRQYIKNCVKKFLVRLILLKCLPLLLFFWVYLVRFFSSYGTHLGVGPYLYVPTQREVLTYTGTHTQEPPGCRDAPACVSTRREYCRTPEHVFWLSNMKGPWKSVKVLNETDTFRTKYHLEC